MNTRVLTIVGAALLLAVPAAAHHSDAMFDYNKNFTVIGDVKMLRWVNPHIHLFVNVPDSASGLVEWDIEGGTPNNLLKTGWSKDVVKAGEKVSIVVHPRKDGSHGGLLVQANRSDGTRIGS